MYEYGNTRTSWGQIYIIVSKILMWGWKMGEDLLFEFILGAFLMIFSYFIINPNLRRDAMPRVFFFSSDFHVRIDLNIDSKP